MDPFFIIAALCMWPVGLFILWKIRYPEIRGDVRVDGGEVSIIIPARDEESRLPLLLLSLQQQTVRPGEIIVVDDGSSDDTSGTAESFHVKLFRADEKPEGWVGKSWACWSGAVQSAHRTLVFLDADVVLAHDGLEKLLFTFEDEKKALAVQPYHTMKKPHEYLSAFFNIIVAAGLGAFTIAGKRVATGGMFGPCLVCSREEYFRAGGHEAVRSEVVENIALGKAFRRTGYEYALFGGRGSVNFRMYPENLRSLVEGWTKSMAAGAGTTSVLLLVLAILWISGGTVAFILLLRLTFIPFTVQTLSVYLLIYLLYSGETWWMLRRIGNFGFLSALLFPVHLMFFHIIFFRSFFLTLFKREITWKGRDTRHGK